MYTKIVKYSNNLLKTFKVYVICIYDLIQKSKMFENVQYIVL